MRVLHSNVSSTRDKRELCNPRLNLLEMMEMQMCAGGYSGEEGSGGVNTKPRKS